MEQDVAGLGEEISIATLLEFDPQNDPDSILGNRWLCRKGSCFWVSQSGTGKSSLEMQAAILWALSRPFFGICPSKPLKSLIVQAENDKGDLAEMFQGIWLGLNLSDSADLIRQVRDNIQIRRINTLTGQNFLWALHRLIDRTQPDLVWLDPLNAYVGDDFTKQTVAASFLREGLGSIAEASGVTWMIMHHTTKPPKDSKAKAGFTISDWAYEGAGASDGTNWSREVVVLKRFDDELFQLLFTKRGVRAGLRDNLGNLRDAEGKRYKSVWLKHSDKGICWLQADPPSEEQIKEAKGKITPRKFKSAAFEYEEFLASIKDEHFTVNKLAERVAKFGGISERTAWRSIIPELKKRMTLDPEDRTYSA